ncbi:MAG: mycothiol system anti-sigma-R factor [Acidimicrobiia bacterium]
MDCEETNEHLQLLLDGELGSFRHRSVVRHLKSCPPCSEEVSFEYEFRQVIARKCAEEAPESLRLRIEQSLGLVQSGGGPSAGQVFSEGLGLGAGEKLVTE